MVEKATEQPGKHRACSCGARTPEEHLKAILNGYQMHTWNGPKLKAK